MISRDNPQVSATLQQGIPLHGGRRCSSSPREQKQAEIIPRGDRESKRNTRKKQGLMVAANQAPSCKGTQSTYFSGSQ